MQHMVGPRNSTCMKPTAWPLAKAVRDLIPLSLHMSWRRTCALKAYGAEGGQKCRSESSPAADSWQNTPMILVSFQDNNLGSYFYVHSVGQLHTKSSQCRSQA